ncbi:MAG: response regulator [Bacteroidales bacterium]|nr:response regulator [Bacteroidales bacterium]
MSINVHRLETIFKPDPKRVIARFFFPGPESRVKNIIKKVIEIDDEQARQTLNQTLRNFSDRHRNISKIYTKHFNHVRHFVDQLGYHPDELPEFKRLLIGSFFTNEYSIESAAFFNPSMVEDPDQSNLQEGQKRIIVSFRATGEGHISSIVFRGGIVNANGTIEFHTSSRLVDEAEIIQNTIYSKNEFIHKLNEMDIDKKIVIDAVMDQLNDTFDYNQFSQALNRAKEGIKLTPTNINILDSLSWLASTNHEITFSLDTAIGDRVIFPISAAESNGIEDARFVKFTQENGSCVYYATYTAYNGRTILPTLIETRDFYHFKFMPLYGAKAHNKGMALFPRKINGKYAMISRIDGINNYIMFSDDLNIWQEASLLQEPKYAWECVQIGNSGSPIETEKGWLLLTHGVGTMRQYSLGAILLDLDDPTKIIGRLENPLLVPNEQEREGYVPNVVYSCGAILNNNKVIIPYAMSDTASSCMWVDLDDLFAKMVPENNHSDFTKKTAHLLLVEDDLINQKVILEILKDESYRITVANDGVSALMEIAKSKFDVVLSDINMPKFDGFELLKYMNEQNIHIPLIFMTSIEDENIEIEGLKLGAVEYIRKPVNPALLKLKLEKLLAKNGY